MFWPFFSSVRVLLCRHSWCGTLAPEVWFLSSVFVYTISCGLLHSGELATRKSLVWSSYVPSPSHLLCWKKASYWAAGQRKKTLNWCQRMIKSESGAPPVLQSFSNSPFTHPRIHSKESLNFLLKYCLSVSFSRKVCLSGNQSSQPLDITTFVSHMTCIYMIVQHFSERWGLINIPLPLKHTQPSPPKWLV